MSGLCTVHVSHSLTKQSRRCGLTARAEKTFFSIAPHRTEAVDLLMEERKVSRVRSIPCFSPTSDRACWA